MRSIYLMIFLFSAAILMPYGCRTQQSLIKKVHSFSFEKNSGTIKATENDTDAPPLDTLMVVYVEATTNVLKWDSALLNGRFYRILPQLITSGSMEAGFNVDGKPVLLKVKEGYFLYQLQFEPLEKEIRNQQTPAKQLIYFRFRNKNYKTILKQPVFLNQLPPV